MTTFSDLIHMLREDTQEWREWGDIVPVCKSRDPLVRSYHSMILRACYEDCLTTAVKFFHAVLPEAEYWVNSKHYWDGDEGPLAIVRIGTIGVNLHVVAEKGKTPAIALIIATLQMLKDKQDRDDKNETI